MAKLKNPSIIERLQGLSAKLQAEKGGLVQDSRATPPREGAARTRREGDGMSSRVWH